MSTPRFDPSRVKEDLLEGRFGIEKESLRILRDGSFSHMPHPFPDDPCIVRDFCENQVEVNTGVSESAEDAVSELISHERRVTDVLSALPEPEYLWPFSNPPYIRDEEDIPVAFFEGKMSEKTVYRHYLSRIYGRYKMTFCGIHVNFSFPEKLLARACGSSGSSLSSSKRRELSDSVYLNLAANLVRRGWIVNVLLSASPLLDSSFLERGKDGGAVFSGMASVRCSELGYWNKFVPVLNYTSAEAYAGSIRKYVDSGLISSQTELYYPVRLKPHGQNDLDNLISGGISHVELRNVDLNPYAEGGIDIRDLKFLHLLFVYCASLDCGTLDDEEQQRAVINFKNAAHYDIDGVSVAGPVKVSSIREAAIGLLSQMREFFDSLELPVDDILDYQLLKLKNDAYRYAARVMNDFSDEFVEKGLVFLRKDGSFEAAD